MDKVGNLADLVRPWLPGQRWFGGKGREFEVSVRALATLPSEPQVTIWLADVTYADGGHETYQLPLVNRHEPVDSLDHVLVGRMGDSVWIYDALHDKEATAEWLVGIRDQTVSGRLRFDRHVDAAQIPVDTTSLVSTAEQSNTSLMFGDQLLLKVFRRLQPGINPDIEVHEALGPSGSTHVAKLMGSVHADVDGQTYALAMAQEFLTSATDGWALATTSVRDLLAEADLHADEAGGDFAGEAQRLGEAVASVHTALVDAFGSDELGGADLSARADAMHQRLDAVAEIVPQLASTAPALHAIFDRLGQPGLSIPTQRIHGDLHLAQALRTYSRWVIIDFEGEPLASFDQRRAFDTPLRDVAGMLRSFEYAGNYRLGESEMDPQLTYRAREWTTRNREAFIDGYARAGGEDPRAHDDVLRAYEVNKALYEAVYEARNRPSWLSIPLTALNRLAGGIS